MRRAWLIYVAEVTARLLGGGGDWTPCEAIFTAAFRRVLRAAFCLLPLAPFGIWKIADLICNLLAR